MIIQIANCNIPARNISYWDTQKTEGESYKLMVFLHKEEDSCDFHLSKEELGKFEAKMDFYVQRLEGIEYQAIYNAVKERGDDQMVQAYRATLS